MDVDYVVFPVLLLLIAISVIWLSIRRIRLLSTKVSRKWRRVVERIVFSAAILFALALAGSTTFNAIAIQIFRATNPPLGKLYTVNGRKMHLYCMGNGSPTIVLEAGMGLGIDLVSWGGIQPELAKTTRVCSYDRAGFGWSEPQPGLRDANHVAQELKELLDQAKVTGPLVLMAHSIGGVFIRYYASRYPTDVVGMILVDSTTPEQITTTPSQNLTALLVFYKTMYIVGVPRLMGKCSAEDSCQPHLNAALHDFQSLQQTGEETMSHRPIRRASDSDHLARHHQSAVHAASREPEGWVGEDGKEVGRGSGRVEETLHT